MSTQVTVAAIAVGGDGDSRLPDGRAVCLPRTAPGDRVPVQRERRSFDLLPQTAHVEVLAHLVGVS